MQLRILRKTVLERHDGAAALDEPSAGLHIGDVAELLVRDAQELCQLQPVRGCLV